MIYVLVFSVSKLHYYFKLLFIEFVISILLAAGCVPKFPYFLIIIRVIW